MVARLLLVFVPFLAAFTGIFALYYLWQAAHFYRLGSVPYAAMSGVMGVAGLALAVTLWRSWRRVRAAAKRPSEGGSNSEMQ